MPASQFITLGIGTPADIPHFLLFGLSPSSGPRQIVVSSFDFRVRIPADDVVVSLPADDVSVVLPRDPEVLL